MNPIDKIALNIIKEQELIVGPVAWQEARKVHGLVFAGGRNGGVSVENGDPKTVIDGLVNQYEHLFGRASREVCKEAASSFIRELSPAEIPSTLR